MIPTILAACATAATRVSINATCWNVNGAVTSPGSQAEGLLLNARLIQGVFDDENKATVGNWAYPDTGRWDPERNTDELAGNLTGYKAAGMHAFTVGLMGGSPQCYGNEGWVVSAFKSDGTLKPAWLGRLDRLLGAADAAGMIVIVQYFYSYQFAALKEPEKAVDAVTKWLLQTGRNNFLIEVFNERCDATQARYIDQVHAIGAAAGRTLLASVSCGGGGMPADEVIASADFVLLHGNGQSPASVRALVDKVRAADTYTPKPVVFNEDDHGHFGGDSNLAAAVSSRASWGFLCCCKADTPATHYARSSGYQCPPVNWGLEGECLSGSGGKHEPNMTKGEFFAATRALTAAPPAAPARAMRVAFVGNSYTFFNDLPTVFASVSAALPNPVHIVHNQSTPGGSSLFQHANASLPMGQETRALLSSRWDVVVLQDQSQSPGGGRDGRLRDSSQLSAPSLR
jgi:hypothetical protein